MLVRNVKYALNSDRQRNVYIGGATYWNGGVQRKASPLANPYRLADFKDVQERKNVLELYRHWLWKKLKSNDEAVWTALRSLRADSILLCHCYPLPHCHGHAIYDAWTWAVREGLIDPAYKTHQATMEKQAVMNAKALAPSRASAVELDANDLTMRAVMREVATQNYPNVIDEHTEALGVSLPPKKKQGVGAPRKARGITYSTPDPLYNRLDDIAADLAELVTTREYIAMREAS